MLEIFQLRWFIIIGLVSGMVAAWSLDSRIEMSFEKAFQTAISDWDGAQWTDTVDNPWGLPRKQNRSYAPVERTLQNRQRVQNQPFNDSAVMRVKPGQDLLREITNFETAVRREI